MPRRSTDVRYDLLLHPDDPREAAIIDWIEQQRGNYDSLRLFMIEVLEWAMSGEVPQPAAQPAAPNVTIHIDQNAFAPFAESIGQAVREEVKAAYADVALLEASKKANGQRSAYPQ